MKSIYEASIAYGREHQGTVNIEDFEAGANYVLEQIESCIDRHEDGCLALEAIILTIDELKE